LTILLTNLPRLGLLHETWQVLVTAFRMERASRPQGTATTEFDRLLRTAVTCTLESAVRCSRQWRKAPPRVRRSFRRIVGSGPEAPAGDRVRSSSPFAPRVGSRRRRSEAGGRRSGRRARYSSFRPPATVLPIVKYLVERYVTLWLKHSGSVRLSPVELLNEPSRWKQVKEFIEAYGHDLLHAPMLMLSNIRAILHQGVSEFLDFLELEQDPLHPVALIEDIDNGKIDREEACDLLELCYETILDKLDRFVEYNTTTTQSDYGGMFYCLLDFLRVEASYDRDAWNLRPFQMAHLVLAEHGSAELAREWERMVREKTRRKAASHLKKLHALEEAYSVRLPSVSDHVGERFVKVMAVHRMRALIDRALRESHEQTSPPRCFLKLRREIDAYLETSTGSAVEVPEWLSRLDREIRRHENDEGPQASEPDAPPVIVAREYRPLRPRQLLRELQKWKRKMR